LLIFLISRAGYSVFLLSHAIALKRARSSRRGRHLHGMFSEKVAISEQLAIPSALRAHVFERCENAR
jgi:hypothetical protein